MLLLFIILSISINYEKKEWFENINVTNLQYNIFNILKNYNIKWKYSYIFSELLKIFVNDIKIESNIQMIKIYHDITILSVKNKEFWDYIFNVIKNIFWESKCNNNCIKNRIQLYKNDKKISELME